jgi:hypothetical protein
MIPIENLNYVVTFILEGLNKKMMPSKEGGINIILINPVTASLK